MIFVGIILSPFISIALLGSVAVAILYLIGVLVREYILKPSSIEIYDDRIVLHFRFSKPKTMRFEDIDSIWTKYRPGEKLDDRRFGGMLFPKKGKGLPRALDYKVATAIIATGKVKGMTSN